MPLGRGEVALKVKDEACRAKTDHPVAPQIYDSVMAMQRRGGVERHCETRLIGASRSDYGEE